VQPVEAAFFISRHYHEACLFSQNAEVLGELYAGTSRFGEQRTMKNKAGKAIDAGG
jgi:hypothetical protein